MYDFMLQATIIIPTHNRHKYLKQILDYYNTYENIPRIIIVDSSSDENKLRNSEIISSFTDRDITCYRNFSSDMPVYSKIAEILNKVKTEYSVLCADDDFVTPSGIKKAVEFLETNLDYSCAHGDYISYTVKEGKGNLREFVWRPIYPFVSITHDNPFERFFAHLENYYPTFYAVHRTDIFKRAFTQNLEATDDYRFGELFLSLYALIHGKMKKIDGLYNAREFLETSTGATISKMTDYKKEGNFEGQYTKFRDHLAHVLAERSACSLESSQETIDMDMRSYLNARQGSSKARSNLGKTFERLPLPLSIQNGMKKVINNISSDGVEPWRTATPGTENIDDFTRIKNTVLEHLIFQ